jgi:SprT-like family
VYNPFVISHSKRSKLLEAKFFEFNKLYFESKLPKYKVLLCSKPKPFGHEVAGYCLTKRHSILIRNGMGKQSTLQTLVHEMAHAKLSALKSRQVHGIQFAKELGRLRKLGAPLSPLDVDKQKKNPRSHLLTRRNIEKLI